uniref:Uncharacterized protein n=2 Tax=Clastoptera arizonana TaxID=38151 RepID=A0A1B6C036_9HEMI
MTAFKVALLCLIFNLININALLTKLQDSAELEDDVSTFDDRSLIEQQIPEDIIFDLIGRAMLITEDVISEKKKTFLLKKDTFGFPYLIDPIVHKKYIVQYSIISSDIDIFRVITEFDNGVELVVDPITDRLFTAELNKYKEIVVYPVQIIGSRNQTIRKIIKEKGYNAKKKQYPQRSDVRF